MKKTDFFIFFIKEINYTYYIILYVFFNIYVIQHWYWIILIFSELIVITVRQYI